jgi:hypothetical protein
MMIEAAEEVGENIGVSAACRALSVPRSSVYRARKPKAPPAPRPTPDRALSPAEKREVRAVLNSERFCDSAPREGYATGVIVRRNRVIRNYQNGIKLWAGGRIENNAVWGQGNSAMWIGTFHSILEVVNNTIASNMWAWFRNLES